MATKNVNLSEQQARFIRKSVKGGRFRNASEVVRAGLRLLEQQQREDALKLQRLQQMVQEGFDAVERGEYEDVKPGELNAFLARMDARVRAAVAARR